VGPVLSSGDHEGESTVWWRAELIVFSYSSHVSWNKSKSGGIIPFALLHRVHSSFHIVVIAVELFLKEFLAFCQLTKSFIHAFHFLLTLEAFPVFAAHITSNCIENTLEAIFPWYLLLVLKFKEIWDGKCLHRGEFQPICKFNKLKQRESANLRSDILQAVRRIIDCSWGLASWDLPHFVFYLSFKYLLPEIFVIFGDWFH